MDDPDIITEVDKHLTTFLTPTRPAEALPGPTTIHRFLTPPPHRTRHPAAEHDTHPRALGIHFRTTGTGHTQIQAVLAADDALDIHTILRATATAEDTTLHDALLGLLRGTMHSPKVVYNLYGPDGGTPTYLAGAGYLDDRQARYWAERITRTMDTPRPRHHPGLPTHRGNHPGRERVGTGPVGGRRTAGSMPRPAMLIMCSTTPQGVPPRPVTCSVCVVGIT
ncbi:hypothetical protein COCCU_02850 [Corynebacterium occultum]|uniref:Uncharacterized protein n=1 Tax=Corynebacterium occultum TaxID=2675219 RepID=A0A6B8VYX8_9CORY|nr:hypothetical protein [Corynebacterium occultum]QGU06524.1 hypothetical protein COCCU_02850 [Corynebacterium occultum]